MTGAYEFRIHTRSGAAGTCRTVITLEYYLELLERQGTDLETVIMTVARVGSQTLAQREMDVAERAREQERFNQEVYPTLRLSRESLTKAKTNGTE